jgi:O-antigen/teichoic acid export membrane protein
VHPPPASNANVSPGPEPERVSRPVAAPPVAGNVVWRLLGTAVRVAIAFVSVPLYMRFIGASQWGLLVLFQAAAAPMALLDLGVGPALIKRVAEARGRGDDVAVARSVRAALSFSLVVIAVGACAILLLSGWFARTVFAIPEADVSTALRGFRFVALSWVTGVPLAFSSNLLVAHQRYDEVLRASTLALVVSTVSGLAAAAATRDAAYVVLAQATGAILAASFAWWRAARLIPRSGLALRWDGPELRRLLGFGGWYTVANTGVLLASWSDRYILGAWFAPRTVGFYSLAQQLQQLIGTTFTEAGDVLFPAVSLRHGMGEVSAARRLALLAGWLLTSVFGPVAITVGVLGGDFLQLWISPAAAQEAGGVLRLLCATSIVALAAVAPVFFALGTGRSYWQAPFSLTSGILSLVVSIALVPSMGIKGVGVGLFAGAALRWLLFVPLWRSLFRSGVSVRDFFLHVCAPPLLSLLLLGALAYLHDSVPHVPGWLVLFAEGAAVLAVAGAAQIGIGELLPGGGERRRDVVGSFRPVVVRAYSLLRGGASR